MKRHAIVVALVGALAAGSLAACRDDRPAVGDRAGVTSAPCPRAVDRAKGCVYLGILDDLTAGAGASDGMAVTEAQQRFWDRVNRAGGIGGYEIDAVTYVRDTRGDTRAHVGAYREIRGKVLALARTAGSGGTAAIVSDLRADSMVAAPASWSSAWAFEPMMLESGANYCVEALNAVDYARSAGTVRSVLALHLPGDYGDDFAAGVRAAADANGASFINVKTDPGAERQDGAVGAIIARRPDVVMLAVTPAETEVIVRKAVERGFSGRMIGAGPTWHPDLLRTPAAPALRATYLRSSPFPPWSADTPGHRAMRAALGSLAPQEGQVAGWVWSYPLKAALEAATARGDLTRRGLASAARELTSVDYEGMLPAGAGNYAAQASRAPRPAVSASPGAPPPTGAASTNPLRPASASGASDAVGVAQTMILSPATGSGVTDVPVAREFFAGPTVGRFALDRPCFQDL